MGNIWILHCLFVISALGLRFKLFLYSTYCFWCEPKKESLLFINLLRRSQRLHFVRLSQYSYPIHVLYAHVCLSLCRRERVLSLLMKHARRTSTLLKKMIIFFENSVLNSSSVGILKTIQRIRIIKVTLLAVKLSLYENVI